MDERSRLGWRWQCFPAIGYRIECRCDIVCAGVVYFLLFGLLAIPLGLAIRFLHYTYNHEKWLDVPPGLVFTFLFTALPEEAQLGDFIQDRGVVSPAEAVINLNLKEQTDHVLKSLTPREEKVVKMRLGLEDGSEHTLEEVGQSFAVTRERIRQIMNKALGKLRHPSRSRKLRALLDTRSGPQAAEGSEQ